MCKLTTYFKHFFFSQYVALLLKCSITQPVHNTGPQITKTINYLQYTCIYNMKYEEKLMKVTSQEDKHYY
jgi:hypothetical protein